MKLTTLTALAVIAPNLLFNISATAEVCPAVEDINVHCNAGNVITVDFLIDTISNILAVNFFVSPLTEKVDSQVKLILKDHLSNRKEELQKIIADRSYLSDLLVAVMSETINDSRFTIYLNSLDFFDFNKKKLENWDSTPYPLSQFIIDQINMVLRAHSKGICTYTSGEIKGSKIDGGKLAKFKKVAFLPVIRGGSQNSRNGSCYYTLQSQSGVAELTVPRKKGIVYFRHSKNWNYSDSLYICTKDPVSCEFEVGDIEE